MWRQNEAANPYFSVGPRRRSFLLTAYTRDFVSGTRGTSNCIVDGTYAILDAVFIFRRLS